MHIQVWTELQLDNKAAISAEHSLQSFRRLVRVMSHLVAFTQVAGESLMKGICSQLTGFPPQLVPVHVHQWKATFFPLSGAWLWRTAKKRRWEKWRTITSPNTGQTSQCEVSVHEWTNKQRGLSHDPTASPIPGQHSLCSSITRQTHAYSRAGRSAAARTTCRAVKIQREHVNHVSDAWKEDTVAPGLHNYCQFP